MKILMFDGFSILNRAFYAIPQLSNSSGVYTNAVYGFLNIFFRFCDEEKPDYVMVAFDVSKPTFRHEMYGAYKATRKSKPEELRMQVPIIKELLKKMQIFVAECPGYEADDILGTLAKQAESQNMQAVIISGDRDLLQLATDTIKIRLPKTKAGKTEVEDFYAKDVLEKCGVSPSAFVDVKGLMGDTSDNIPGVPGIGEVTATKIITTYGSLDEAIKNVAEVKPKKASENLSQFREQAILSQKLATIVQDAPIELTLTTIEQVFNAEAFEEVKRLELKSLYKRFTENGSLLSYSQVVHQKIIPEAVIIKTITEAQDFIKTLEVSGKDVSMAGVWNGSELMGIGFATNVNKCDYTYISCTTEMTINLDTDISEISNFEISQGDLIKLLKPWLESESGKLVFDGKNEIGKFSNLGVALNGIVFDVMLAAYVLNALAPNKTLSDIALTYLNETVPSIEDLLKGKRSDKKTIADLSSEMIASCAGASIIALVYPIMEEALIKAEQQSLYYDIEFPLSFVLAKMEKVGIKVDRQTIKSYGETLDIRLKELTQNIYDVAGEEFNINSPSQLGVILFEKLGLKGGKKTSHGYSTAADELDKLEHPIIPLVQEYRVHSKLKSTYVDGLLPLINPQTSRIHSTLHQALTATGRLSSAEPNLQNIPVRMPLGRELRKAFLPEIPKETEIEPPLTVFVSADYSQIELRLLAHISGDTTLINAFKENQDIHRLTASQVLGIAPEDVTTEERNNAKAVNFGIVYGISAFGLAKDLGISTKEAEKYIQGYFAKYPKVKVYLDETIKNAKEKGFVATLYNRRRQVPELNSSVYNIRSFGERVAMNMPIQGTAADIIKIAMINVDKRLNKKANTPLSEGNGSAIHSRLILQIHDELLLEVPTNELEEVKVILKEEMESAATLEVPLVVDINVGSTWYDTK